MGNDFPKLILDVLVQLAGSLTKEDAPHPAPDNRLCLCNLGEHQQLCDLVSFISSWNLMKLLGRF